MAKKRLVVSYNNLGEELQKELKEKYPLGFTEQMIRIDKGAGDFFYAVMLDTEDISYLVKIDVKIDGNTIEDDTDKDDYYDDEIRGADEIADAPDDDDE